MHARVGRRQSQGLLAALMVAIMIASMPGMVSADQSLDAPRLYSPGAGHSGDLILVWVKVAAATSYTAQVALDANFTSPISLSTNLGRVTFTGLFNGWYYCRVMANQGAVNSNWSEVKQVRVYDDPKLAATSFTSMTISGGSVTCYWSAIPSASRYMVEICADPNFDPPIYHADTTDTTWTFSNLSSGIYQVRVCGYNTTAWSGWTLNATAFDVPGAPVLTSAIAGVNSAVISWTAPTSNGSTPITGYNVYYGPTEPTTQFGGTLPTTTLTISITGLMAGTQYHLAVKAVNVAGNSSNSNVLNITVMTVPGAPTGLTATPGNGKVTLIWQAPITTGGSPITGYIVYRGAQLIANTDATTSNYVDNSCATGTIYTYYVTATNSAGTGPSSTPISASSQSISSTDNTILYAGIAIAIIAVIAVAAMLLRKK